MAKRKKQVHTLTIKNRAPGTVSRGATTQVLLDGRVLKGVTDLAFSVSARGTAKVCLVMLVDLKETSFTMLPKNITVIAKTTKDVIEERECDRSCCDQNCDGGEEE